MENRNGGMELLKSWEKQHGKMPMTPTAESGSGGRHFYFKTNAEFTKVGKEKIPFTVGAELLVGGDVIVPPSNHFTGGRYRWLLRRRERYSIIKLRPQRRGWWVRLAHKVWRGR